MTSNGDCLTPSGASKIGYFAPGSAGRNSLKQNTLTSDRVFGQYGVFVTDLVAPIDFVVWFYNQHASAENLIKEANNDV